jgi:predicted dehydrogenase
MTVTIAVLGAGNRGNAYARWVAAHPGQARIVAVAEPDPVRRERFAARFGVPAGGVFESWEELAAAGPVASAVIVATQDSMHCAPVLRFAAAGTHVMVEKPLAPTEEDCRAMVAAAMEAGVIFAVGHVLRYTPYTIALKALLDSGRIGEIVSVRHLEPVGFWHQAHSFVRGNWRNEKQSSFMLMAKSCHDLDWLGYVVGQPVKRVSSFGGLAHFTAANRPEGAADRCLDCRVEASCAYSAARFYGQRLAQKRFGWPLDVVLDDFTEPALERAMREGPYGRCVYACDNDVVDHQVAALEFANGVTATFTMTGLSAPGHRQTQIFGTRGQIDGDGQVLRIYDFLSGGTEIVDTATGGASAADGHGGGDAGLMRAFVTAVATGDASAVLSGPQASLDSHLVVFATERARRTGAVVTL